MEKIFDFGIDLLLPMFSSQILAALERLQKEQDPPYSDGVYYIELRKAFMKGSGFSLINKLTPVIFDPILCNLFRTNIYYYNSDHTKMSIKKISDEYYKFREGIEYKFPGYTLDKRHLVVSLKGDSDGVDLHKLKDILVSKDMIQYQQIERSLFTEQPRFLNRQNVKGIAYASYPRSGNTFLRKYFETITGTATGSDMVMKFDLNVALQFAGFKGEGIVDERIWINKTHFPLRLIYDKPYKVNCVVVCVRNPLDVFVSEFLQLCTMSHNLTINEPFHLDYPEWDWMIKQETKLYKKWHDYWIEKCKNHDVPVFFCRFEDLLNDPRQTLRDIFSFLLKKKDISATVIEKRIDQALKIGSKGNELYKPKPGGQGVFKNMFRYNEVQMEHIKKCLEEYIHFFGYNKKEGNPYGVFDFEGKQTYESECIQDGYKKLNEATWRWLEEEKVDIDDLEFHINHEKEGFNFIGEKDVTKLVQIPAKSTIKA